MVTELLDVAGLNQVGGLTPKLWRYNKLAY
jgi:hypothetical protein